ncbi:MAG: diguanylate cyclase [Candidatus Omnitrophota bacterium]
MQRFFKSLALIPRGLKYKLSLVFSVMSLIPILALLYIIFAYVFSLPEIVGNRTLVILLSILISFFGFVLAGNIIAPIIKMAKDAHGVANGKIISEITVDAAREDEIGQLGVSLNVITSRLHKNMNELRNYENKIRLINMEINKKILILSSLFQISNIISSGSDLKVILQFIIDKLHELIKSEKTFLMLIDSASHELVVKASCKLSVEDIESMQTNIDSGILGKIIFERKTIIIDSSFSLDENLTAFVSKNKLKNMIIVPIILRLKNIGLLVCGNNNKDFVYESDDIEVLNVFIKQIAIAFENDFLLNRTKALTTKDELTGIYNINYFNVRFPEEIQRAITYQRPCSLILIDIDDFKQVSGTHGENTVNTVLKKIALILESATGEIDKIIRFGDDEFAVICPEKNKMEALAIAETVRKEIEKTDFLQAKDKFKPITISAGISANPLDGIVLDEIVGVARRRLERAKTEGKNKVIASEQKQSTGYTK